MDDCVDELLATDIREEHRDSVGYFALVREESEIGDEIFAGGLGCDAGLALEVADGFFRDIFPLEPGADAHIEVELSGIVEDYADIGRSGIMAQTGLSLPSVKRYIAELTAKGYIEHRGSKKTGGYFPINKQ
jgi:hypothetical protein